MERASDDSTEESTANNGNNAGRNLKVEALTTVRQLERFLAKSVARQWYDMERSTFNFVQKIKAEAPIVFTYDVSFTALFYDTPWALSISLMLLSLLFFRPNTDVVNVSFTLFFQFPISTVMSMDNILFILKPATPPIL